MSSTIAIISSSSGLQSMDINEIKFPDGMILTPPIDNILPGLRILYRPTSKSKYKNKMVSKFIGKAIMGKAVLLIKNQTLDPTVLINRYKSMIKAPSWASLASNIDDDDYLRLRDDMLQKKRERIIERTNQLSDMLRKKKTRDKLKNKEYGIWFDDGEESDENEEETTGRKYFDYSFYE